MPSRNLSIPYCNTASLKNRAKWASNCYRLLIERYKPELEAEITNVDAYFGTNDLQNLLASVGANYKHELIGERLLTTPSHFAYFKIAEGCNRPCSFCAIPLMRGKHLSTPIDQLVKNAENLSQKRHQRIDTDCPGPYLLRASTCTVNVTLMSCFAA
jgi:hypothetical protein